MVYSRCDREFGYAGFLEDESTGERTLISHVPKSLNNV